MVSYTAPESMLVVSANPATISITDGADTVHYVQLLRHDRDGRGLRSTHIAPPCIKDTGEPGLPACGRGLRSSPARLPVTAHRRDGSYTINAPNNMPAATMPYEVTVIPPGGYYLTSSSQISPSGWPPGTSMSNFTQITLN